MIINLVFNSPIKETIISDFVKYYQYEDYKIDIDETPEMFTKRIIYKLLQDKIQDIHIQAMNYNLEEVALDLSQIETA